MVFLEFLILGPAAVKMVFRNTVVYLLTKKNSLCGSRLNQKNVGNAL
jgi:hypothetical protein